MRHSLSRLTILLCLVGLSGVTAWSDLPASENPARHSSAAAEATAAGPEASPKDEDAAAASDKSKPADSGETEPVIEVEVRASHEWPAKVETISTAQVEEMVNAPFIGDVIERLPGVDTLHGCLNGADLITVRGNNSEWTQLVLEGIPLSPIGRPYILSFVPMSAIDTVRLLTGPVPPKYCDTTIAGLVLLDMKTGDRYPGTRISTTIGGYGERIFDVNVGGGDAARNYFLSFTHNRTLGWLPHSDMNWNFVSGKFVLNPDERSKLTLVGADMFGDKNGPRPLGPNPKDKWGAEWTDVRQPKASATYERKLSDRQDIMFRFVPTWFSGTQTWNQWFTDHVEQRFMPWKYDLFRTEFQHNIHVSPEGIWTWGSCWQEDEYRFTDPLKLSFMDNIPADKRHDYTKRARSIYAQYTQPAGSTGTLTLGGRYDTENPGQSIASPFASWFTHLDPNTGLRLAFTRNRRFPNLSELYGQGVWTGNPALQPEMGWTYQADLTRTLNNGTVGLSVYDSQLEDLIVANSDNIYGNVGKARLRGLETSWRHDWRKASVWASYTYLDAQNLTTDDPLIAAFRTAFPKHTAKVGVSIADERGGEHVVEVFAYGRRRTDVNQPTFVGDPWNVTVPPSLPGFTWVNYKYSRQLNANAKLTLAMENVFNAEAQDLLFYPRPGRWVSASMSWDF
jgi:outer membrane receptor protein involved in Fe transport